MLRVQTSLVGERYKVNKARDFSDGARTEGGGRRHWHWLAVWVTTPSSTSISRVGTNCKYQHKASIHYRLIVDSSTTEMEFLKYIFIHPTKTIIYHFVKTLRSIFWVPLLTRSTQTTPKERESNGVYVRLSRQSSHTIFLDFFKGKKVCFSKVAQNYVKSFIKIDCELLLWRLPLTFNLL